MSYRISSTDIQNILSFDPSITDLDPFIAAAEELVNNLCVTDPISGDAVGYSDATLVQIETWLAAHMVAMKDPLAVSEGVGPASKSYMRTGGLNLQQTHYGQMAMMQDWKGQLAWISEHHAKGKRQKAGVVHLGTDMSEYSNYPWRFLGLFG